MSIYGKSSLVLIPSGTKTGKVFSQKPVSGDGDFTFTRSSAATRVNADGFIEKETQNLLYQSNNFESGFWTKTNTSVTSGQSGYDGSDDAWKLEATAASTAYVRQFIDTSSSVSTFSFYAKAGTANWTYVNCVSVTAFFNLSNGTTGYVNSNAIDASITSVGGGWYRVSLTGTGMTQQRIYTAPANNSSISAIGDNIYIQDTQLEQGLVARDYIETTSPVEGGITDNVPRLDYTDSSCPALLLEPQRSNVITHSEYFEDTSWWFATSADVELSENLSPEGVKNAYKVTYGAGGNRLGGASFGLANTPNTNSVYMRKVSGSGIVNFRNQLGSGNLVTLTESWERYDVTATLVDGTARLYIDLQTLGDVIEVYGAQQEAGSYATSYIPTYGSSVTRTQDLASFSYDAATTAWSIFMDVKNWTDILNKGQFSLGNTADTTNSLFYFSNCFGIQKEVGQAYFCSRLAVLGQSFNGKFAVIFDGVNTIKLYINGTLDTTSTLADTAKTSGIDSANLYYPSSDASKEIKSLLVFPTALTDQEAIDLTTI